MFFIKKKVFVQFILAFLLLQMCGGTVNLYSQIKSAHYVPEVNKANVSFRISIGQSLPEKRFIALLDVFDKYKGATSEITFFTSSVHPPPPLDVLKKRVEILKVRMEQARKRGYKTGINILNTVGHHDEDMENALKGDFTRMTDIDGKVCMGAFCSNDKNYREQYIVEIYKAMALSNPDYIWIDDDVRLQGHGHVRYACFCDNCMKLFNDKHGSSYTRESLKKAFDEGSTVNKLKVRNEWLQHNRNTIATLFELIEKTVHDINDRISLGFMTGDRFYEGYDFSNWGKILKGTGNVPVMWRPGGGSYNDLTPMSFIDKAHAIGRQVSVLPENILSIQSEIENFPYQRFRKSASMVAFEAAAYIASGCTGAAYNVLTFYDEPLDEYMPLVDSLKNVRAFLDLMTSNLARKPLTGVVSYWNVNSAVAANPETGSWLNGRPPLTGYDLFENGLPASYYQDNAPVTLLGKDMIFSMSREEIQKLLSSGVYIDAEALEQLNKMGFSDLTGFETTGSQTSDQIERLTHHPLNGKFAGRWRDNRQSFWMQPAYGFRKTNNNAQIISELIDYGEKVTAECTMGIFENRLGGRICVAGYYPWTNMGNLSKNEQIKSVFRWLSKDRLPGYIQSFHKMNLWIRDTQNNRVALALSNSSFDVARNIVLMLKTNTKRLKYYDAQMKETTIHSSGKDGPYEKFIIPEMDPWKIGLVISE